ncbi:MAG: N-acetyl-gamma-glutamyl-phosphate reductase [Chloroflexi bacterium RBG_16_68_14]|nr:MAG: N-acetyl-gamma-glutamyl-phosphate reductase [Chloroflexi bacterium RBG_16_68_14]
MGAEAARLLHGHPEVELTSVTGRSAAGQPLGEVFPHLGPLGLTVEEELGEVDAVVSALPHSASAQALLPYIERGLPVLDLSADFRLRRLEDYEPWYGAHPAPHLLAEAVFGLPELHREEIARSKLVAGPGCHATAAILALAPAVRHGLIEPDMVVDSKTGISGAGRSLGLSYHFSEANEGVSAYGLSGHRQLPEMTQELGALWEAPAPRITFVPHLIPMTRGILVTCYASLRQDADLGKDAVARLRELYCDFYRDSPFVRIVDQPPSTKQTLGCNDCLLYPTVDGRAGRLIVVSVLDNLVKGGAGQGVQCLNLMLGLPETAGLSGLALYP